MATRQSSRREFDDDIWKFLDHEESDYQTIGEVRERTQAQPSREFLRPAVFRSSLASVDSQHYHDDIQLPTFAQKFSGSVPDGSIKPSRTPFRLPRTVFKGEDDDDPNALYGVPKKLLPRSTTTSRKRDSFDSIINDHPGFSGSLFKRYEAGSILSTISSEQQPPVVYHHDSETLVRERDGIIPDETYRDDVVFSNVEDLFWRPHKRWAIEREGKKAGGRIKCSCCSGKVVVGVVAVVLVVVAVVAIAVGVSLSTTSNNSSDGPNSNLTAETTRPVVTASPGVTVTRSPTLNCKTFTTNEMTALVELLGSLKFHGGNFTAVSIDSNDTLGNATRSICKAFESGFCTLNQSDIAYENCTIRRYTNGSIIAEFQIFLIKRSNINNDTAIQLVVKEAINTAVLSLHNIFPGVDNASLLNDTLTILPVSVGTTPSKVANTQGTTPLSGNGLTTNPVSSAPMVSNNTQITMVTDTSQFPQSVSTNSANSTSASDHGSSSRKQVSVSTSLSQNGTATNSVSSAQTSHSHVVTDSTSSSRKITTSEIITKFKTTPSDAVTYRTTGEPVRTSIASTLISNSWARRVSASLTGSATTSRVPALSSEVVTTSQAKTSPKES